MSKKQIFRIRIISHCNVVIPTKTEEEGYEVLNNMSEKEILNLIDDVPVPEEVNDYGWIGEINTEEEKE